jgi:hypothetical protein
MFRLLPGHHQASQEKSNQVLELSQYGSILSSVLTIIISESTFLMNVDL